VARRLLERVPRLHTVAQIIERQYEPYEVPFNESPEGYVVGLGAQMLRVAMDFDQSVSQGRSFSEAYGELRQNAAEYHPEILGALGKVVRDATAAEAGTAMPPGPRLMENSGGGIAEQALP
jgi:hypothetical protein